MDSLQVLYAVYFLAIFIHVVALVNTALYVIPLQVKEARVKNGLAKLRILMLFSGVITILLSALSIIVLSLRFFIDGEVARYTIVSLVLLHSLGFLASSLITRKMYRQQYSEKQKLFHEKIDALERKEETRKEHKVTYDKQDAIVEKARQKVDDKEETARNAKT